MTQEDETQVTDETPEVELPLPGDMLREAREQQKLTIADVAARLRLRKQLIEELEENKFDPKVAGTFTRGYLRSYAKFLQIDEDAVIAAYYELGIEKPVRDNSMQSFSQRTKHESQDNRLMIITYIIIALLVASVALTVWQQSGDDDAAEGPSPEAVIEIDPAEAYGDEAEATLTPIEAPTERSTASQNVSEAAARQELTEPTEPVSNEPAPVVRTESQTQTPATRTSSTPTTQTAAVPAPTVSSDAERTGVDPTVAELVLYFRGDCWIRIDDAAGNALAYGVKPEGYTMPLSGDAPYAITLGAPHLVDIYFQGEAVDMTGFREGRVARLTVPRS
ncbi:MAG: DUF4115 domain-containing protein [Idiomarina sp.]|nr:DUF4115 domain-containing protein [Idiomarina sp.]